MNLALLTKMRLKILMKQKKNIFWYVTSLGPPEVWWKIKNKIWSYYFLQMWNFWYLDEWKQACSTASLELPIDTLMKGFKPVVREKPIEFRHTSFEKEKIFSTGSCGLSQFLTKHEKKLTKYFWTDLQFSIEILMNELKFVVPEKYAFQDGDKSMKITFCFPIWDSRSLMQESKLIFFQMIFPLRINGYRFSPWWWRSNL